MLRQLFDVTRADVCRRRRDLFCSMSTAKMALDRRFQNLTINDSFLHSK